MSKWIGLFFLLLAAIGLPVTAQAACTISSGTLPVVLSFSPWSPANFDPSVANGTVVALQVLNFSSVGASGATVTCSGGLGTQTRAGTTGAQEAVYMTYPTAIAGVGIRFTTQGRTGAGYGVWPTSLNLGTGTTSTITSAGSVLVEFVKVGTITAGGTIVGEQGASRPTRVSPSISSCSAPAAPAGRPPRCI